MTHLEEVKTWLAALELLRMANFPTFPKVPPSVATLLMDQAMELDERARDELHEAAIP